MSTDPNRFRDLEAVIDGVVASYTGALEIDNLESAALPNKRAVIEAFGHLKSAIFVGFYATHALSRANLRATLAEHMHGAHRSLVEQIERALNYDHRVRRLSCPLPTGSGERVVLELLAELPELRRLIDADVRAAYDGDPAAQNVEEIVFSYPSIEAVVAYRIANRLHRAGVPMIPRILSEHAHSCTGIDINPGASIGERFFIDHGTGVVIGETSVIGDDVKIYQGVTLGALSVPHRSETKKKRHPTIEDAVTIYAGATILGGDTVIGARSVVGGNVLVVRSVPPDSKVFGRSRGDEATPKTT